MIRNRCSDLATQLNISIDSNNDLKECLEKNELKSLLDKFENLLIEENKKNQKNVDTKPEEVTNKKESINEARLKKMDMPIEEMAAMEQEMTKSNEIIGKLKINRRSNEPENYFARKTKPLNKKLDEKKIQEAKLKVLEKLNEKYSNRKTQMISANEGFNILKEHDKKVQVNQNYLLPQKFAKKAPG